MRTVLPPSLARVLAPAVAGALALACYLFTISPHIGLLHGTVDGAELVVVASKLGVAHPPGSAIWMPLGWGALNGLTVIPEPALRTNVLSAVLMGAAVAALAVATMRWRPTTPPWAAALAGLLGGLAPIVWAEAIVTEVLALQALLAALALALAIEASAGRRWPLFALVLGLLAWNHPTGLALGVPLGLAAVVRARPPRRAWPWTVAAFLAPGLYTVAYLLLRADAAIAWGDTGTLPGVWAHLSGTAYQRVIDLSPAHLGGAVPASLRLALWQVPPPLWPLLPVGAALLARTRPLLAGALGVAVALLVVFVAAYRATGHEDYLAPVAFVEAMLAAWGAEALWGWLRPRVPGMSMRAAVAVCAAGLVVVWAAYVGTRVTLRGDTRILDEARATLASAPAGGVLEVTGDVQTFPLWYAQAMLGERPDVTIRNTRGLAPTLRGGEQVR
ncbi:MAG: DUF2723 domain-containing protein [Dehalococcoidia bacterium]